MRYLLVVFSFIYMMATQKTFFSVSDYLCWKEVECFLFFSFLYFLTSFKCDYFALNVKSY